MKKWLIGTLLIPVTLGFSGCVTNNEQAGGLAGGVLGAVVGSQFGGGSGRVAASVAGALIGAWAGSQWGRSLDEASMRRAMQAERAAAYSGERTEWRTRRYYGEVIPEPEIVDNCRRYKSIIYIDGRRKTAYGTACETPDGRWELVSS